MGDKDDLDILHIALEYEKPVQNFAYANHAH